MNPPSPPNTFPNIKAISFDADDTLWDFQSAMKSALTSTLAQIRSIAPNAATEQLTVEKMADIREQVASELGEGVVSNEQIRYEALVRTLEYVGAPSQTVAAQLLRSYTEARFAHTTPYPDVAPALKTLKRRYRIGIVSNGNSYPERCGLPDTFDFTIFAHDCGFHKPDRRIFELALSKTGCQPHEVLHVGDSLESDVLGAQNCGLRTAWLNRQAVPNHTGIAPDLEVPNLSALLECL